MPVAIHMPNVREDESTATKLARAIQGAGAAYESALDRKFREQQAARQEKLETQRQINYENEQQAKGDQQIIENHQKAQALAIQEKLANRRGEVDPATAMAREMKMEKMREDAAKAAFAKTPEGRMQGLNTEAKARFDNIRMATEGIKGMSDALGDGDWTISPIGDNNFTQQRQLVKEAIGRMQSGGAIGKDEARDFINMLPGPMDSQEMQQKKLADMSKIMQDRLGTLGFTPDEVGLGNAVLKAPGMQASAPSGGMGLTIPQANAAPAAQPAPALPRAKPGLVRNGYRFRGGDETNKANWEKVK